MALSDLIPSTVLSGLAHSTHEALQNLLEHRAEASDLTSLPVTRLGAVLVLLYEAEDGRIRVLLTTRSKHLRSHPGQTALPGGRVDATDPSYTYTAYREAHEEVGLPLNSPHIFTLCCLRPFISLYRLWVIPVVAFLSAPSLLKDLKPSPDEVDHIFTHPLEAFLDVNHAKGESLVDIGSDDWPYDVELYSTSDSSVPWLNGPTYRMHRFRSSASPIKGLTADIMISVAVVAYNKSPAYERYAPGQLIGFAPMWEAVRLAENRGAAEAAAQTSSV